MRNCMLRSSFFKITRNHRGELFEMRAKNSQMIARHTLGVKAIGETRPNCSRIIWKVGDGFGLHEFYRAVVKAGAILRQ